MLQNIKTTAVAAFYEKKTQYDPFQLIIHFHDNVFFSLWAVYKINPYENTYHWFPFIHFIENRILLPGNSGKQQR